MTRNRVFAFSLGLSAIIHLSMVTVFSIVIFFPQKNVKYYSFNIIDVESEIFSSLPIRHRLRIPSADNALSNTIESKILSGKDWWSSLPSIELPTLEFGQHDLIRTGERGLKLGTEYSKFLGEEPDSWARFTDELQNIGSALSRLRFRGSDLPELKSLPVTRPAPGFEAYISWMSGPDDRQLISAPPITALWGVAPSDLQQDITLIFKVNPQGKVFDILAPLEDEAGIIADTGIALLKYRFEPLDTDSVSYQQGTLLIRSEQKN